MGGLRDGAPRGFGVLFWKSSNVGEEDSQEENRNPREEEDPVFGGKVRGFLVEDGSGEDVADIPEDIEIRNVIKQVIDSQGSVDEKDL